MPREFVESVAAEILMRFPFFLKRYNVIKYRSKIMDIKPYNLIDEMLLNISKDRKPSYYVEPINSNEQKQRFLEGKIKNPEFQYRELEYNPREIEQKLNFIKIPKDEIGAIFQEKKDEILLGNKIVLNRGNQDIVREATIALYGIPSNELVAYAERLLKEIPSIDIEKNVSAKQIKQALEGALSEIGITDWAVEFSDKWLTTTYSAKKKITICKDRKFAKINLRGLAIHEVGVHVLRAANGYRQPLKIFAIGLPTYLSTEEGLSMYFEEITGNTNNEMLRNYAARVVAVDSLLRDLTFRKTFEKLKSYNFSDEQAWNLTLRAFRGGGYIRDHVYLEGYIQVKDFAQKKGDFKALYVGKIGIKDLTLVKDLLKKGILREAKYIPEFIK